MTVEEIEKMSRKEAQDRLKSFYSHAESAQAYLAINDQIAALASAFDSIKIDIESDSSDKAFERFISFGDKLIKIEESQRKRLAMLDENVLRQQKELRLSAAAGTLEQFVNDGFMKG